MTTLPDIPRLYTAEAEVLAAWLLMSCMAMIPFPWQKFMTPVIRFMNCLRKILPWNWWDLMPD